MSGGALRRFADGRVLAVYSKHGPEPHFYYRITESPNNLTRWSPVRKHVASPTTHLTYSNLLLLKNENGGAGRIYKIGNQAVNNRIEFYYNVEKSDSATDWTWAFTFQFLFPK